MNFKGSTLRLLESRAMARRKNPHAVALGRKGGKKGGPKGGPKGGKARWEGVPPEERSEIARRAVMARWRKRKKA